ncbi:hypothetical protein BDQ12DRAFT_736022 [Crucibulum laeve]|uniref:Uncharacterized protein n=1 Tax=Crucibulum laeve TaxID=68775 RepID=A0A5C3LY29_9AGAR|nr:hypothetical protein BDQ12DRAFT_736022 [Crucibulum laeve]
MSSEVQGNAPPNTTVVKVVTQTTTSIATDTSLATPEGGNAGMSRHSFWTTGAIIGVSVGSAVVLALAILLMLAVKKYRKVRERRPRTYTMHLSTTGGVSQTSTHISTDTRHLSTMGGVSQTSTHISQDMMEKGQHAQSVDIPVDYAGYLIGDSEYERMEIPGPSDYTSRNASLDVVPPRSREASLWSRSSTLVAERGSFDTQITNVPPLPGKRYSAGGRSMKVNWEKENRLSFPIPPSTLALPPPLTPPAAQTHILLRPNSSNPSSLPPIHASGSEESWPDYSKLWESIGIADLK